SADVFEAVRLLVGAVLAPGDVGKLGLLSVRQNGAERRRCQQCAGRDRAVPQEPAAVQVISLAGDLGREDVRRLSNEQWTSPVGCLGLRGPEPAPVYFTGDPAMEAGGLPGHGAQWYGICP